MISCIQHRNSFRAIIFNADVAPQENSGPKDATWGGRACMFDFKSGDIVLIGEGACGEIALGAAASTPGVRICSFEGVSLEWPDGVTFCDVVYPSMIGRNLCAAAGTRVFLAGRFPRKRIENAQSVQDYVLLTHLLGAAATPPLPQAKATLLALESGCKDADLRPTCLEEALAHGVINYGMMAGPDLSQREMREFDRQLSSMLCQGGEVAFAVDGALIQPARQRPLRWELKKSNFCAEDEAALLWAPGLGEMLDASLLDTELVEECANHHIRKIVLAGRYVIPVDLDAVASACARHEVALYRSRIGD
jgi:hypothetical protein